MLKTWLAGGAEVFVDAKKIPDRRKLLSRDWQRQQHEKTDADSSVHKFASDAWFNFVLGPRASRPPQAAGSLSFGRAETDSPALWHSTKAGETPAVQLRSG